MLGVEMAMTKNPNKCTHEHKNDDRENILHFLSSPVKHLLDHLYLYIGNLSFPNLQLIKFLFCFSHSLVNETMPTLETGHVRRVLKEALDVWSRGSRLTFSEVRGSNADIQVLFAK